MYFRNIKRFATVSVSWHSPAFRKINDVYRNYCRIFRAGVGWSGGANHTYGVKVEYKLA